TDSGRNPWSIVTARSEGPRFSAARQRATSTISAVESGPPDTARTTAGTLARSANTAFASEAETGAPAAAAPSAADTLLFPVDTLLHGDRCARIFARDLAERGARGLLLAERGERLPKAQQCVGRLGGGLVFGRDVEEGFGGVAVALAL